MARLSSCAAGVACAALVSALSGEAFAQTAPAPPPPPSGAPPAGSSTAPPPPPPPPEAPGAAAPPGYAPPPPYYADPSGRPPVGPLGSPPSLEAPPKGIREHDGFYLRMGLGLGRVGATLDSNDSKDYGGRVDGSVRGLSLALELSLGGTVAPGLVLGGGIFVAGTMRAAQDINVNGQRALVPTQNAGIALIAPFVDWYVDPRAGWHVQGALGIGTVVVEDDTDTDRDLRTRRREQGGFGFMLGGGWDAFVSDQWSLGALLRVMYAASETNKDEADRFSYTGLALPEILFTATYH